MTRHRPIAGQRSFLPDVPPIQYCRRCGRRLVGETARKHGAGARCRAIDAGRLEVRHYCQCGHRLDAGELAARHCQNCWRGIDDERSPGRFQPRQRLFKRKPKRKAKR